MFDRRAPRPTDRIVDAMVGCYLDGTYLLSEGPTRNYTFPVQDFLIKVRDTCGPRHARLFSQVTEAPPRGTETFYRGRRVDPNTTTYAHVNVPRVLVDVKPIPLSPDARDQASGTFEIYRLVCSEAAPPSLAPPSLAVVRCAPYGAKLSRSLVKVAATRIFANPYQCFAELVVNAYDAYHPEAKFGKFGMGFFSVLWWLYKDPDAVMRIRSYVPGETWFLTISSVDGDLQGQLEVIRDSKVTLSGTEIDLESNLIDLDLFRAEMEKLKYLPGVRLPTPGPYLSPRDRVPGEISISYRPGSVSVDDYATGIPLEVLAGSLLVPSVSTKTIASFGGSGGRIPSTISYRSSPSGGPSSVVIAVGMVVIKKVLVPEIVDCDVVIGLSHQTHLPVSRDDVILDEGSAADLEAQIAVILGSQVPLALVILEFFVNAYATSGAPRTNIETISGALRKWREAHAEAVVPWEHFNSCYRFVLPRSVVSMTYSHIDIERRLAYRAEETPWLSVRLVFDHQIEKPTFGGLNSVVFANTRIYDTIAQSLTSHFLIYADAPPGSFDYEIRTKALEGLPDLPDIVRDAYVFLISVASTQPRILVLDGALRISREPLPYFREWLIRVRDLPPRDLADIIKAIATNLPKTWTVSDSVTMDLEPKLYAIFTDAVLGSMRHSKGMTIVVSPYMAAPVSLGPTYSEKVLAVAKDMEEYAVLESATRGVQVSTKMIAFLRERFLARVGVKSTDPGYANYYAGMKWTFPFEAEAQSWIRVYSTNLPPAFGIRDRGSMVKYTTKQLISALFAIDNPLGQVARVADEMEFYRRAGTFPTTKLQILDIATNDASTRSPVTATIIELYQNSVDAGAKTLRVAVGISKDLLPGADGVPEHGHIEMVFTDWVGMSALNFLHVQIPFLSTKTEGSSAGEMGSGFFNAFRTTSVVEITTVREGIGRVLVAFPVRAGGRVIDITCAASTYETRDINATSISCYWPCHSVEDMVMMLAEIEVVCKALAESPRPVEFYYSSSGTSVLLEGRKWGQIERPSYSLRTSEDEGKAFTKGVYFGSSTSIDPELTKVDIDLAAGFEPVHSRNRIILSPEVLEEIKFAACLNTEMLPMTDFKHWMSQSIPAVTNDRTGRYLSYPLKPGVTMLTLLREISLRNGDARNGVDREVRAMIASTCVEILGVGWWGLKMVQYRLVQWAASKVKNLGLPAPRPRSGGSTRVPRPSSTTPEYYVPPRDITSYITAVTFRYYETCAKLFELGGRPKVTFFSNPAETGTAGFFRAVGEGGEIAYGIAPSSHQAYRDLIKSLSDPKTRGDAIRRAVVGNSPEWKTLGTGAFPGGRSSTLAHEMEHLRRRSDESESSHTPQKEVLFGVDAMRGFDESAILISEWVAANSVGSLYGPA